MPVSCQVFIGYQQHNPNNYGKKEIVLKTSSILSFDFKLTVKKISSTAFKETIFTETFLKYSMKKWKSLKNLYSWLRIFFVIALVYKYDTGIIDNPTRMVYWCFINAGKCT